ncbi:transcriptional regulator [Vibrio cholerae MAK 757]|uniref:DNA-binding transcriptional activator DecR n=9 Tax=Gammaproteobacteria TaxID=1236 RepID=Q9KT43_VIBCH|nr:transcriptional regulator, AsnC family [Vibrio cholerae O1 biovar El Tor str. N16961]ABQ21579.1 transcriptional regulator, AsnC family [Vibrio cholerae O395]ACP05335.1 transcriptional regulator, AsnC family [Vibrio cholerae M66-2]EAZ75132.1 transcriptional regulator, AsnC family [Vibrio cholerae NCTC 8457]EAZ77825.1 transcriptional regulator, AsnC family [Vibrio cholerae B33]EET22310.1 transcriptional regulator [Vibrio cholerae MO10]EFH75093.1 transcriptional regulator [Vibrio cholerae RC3
MERKTLPFCLCFCSFVEKFSLKKAICMLLDKVDRQILAILQQDCTVSLNELAEAVNLTTTPCWKRLKKMEEGGVIRERVALLDAQALDLSFTAFVMVTTNNHSHEWYCRFVTAVEEFPEVMEFYRMAGEYDYMMKVQVKDMPCFDRFYKKLVNSIEGLNKVTSTFAMESLKYTTQLPL